MPVTISPTLESIVSVANAKLEPKILTEENFEVLSVKPLKLSTTTHNTQVTVKIDLGAMHPLIAIPESDRYTVRNVSLTRINLADVAAFRNIPVNEKGQYIIEAGDVTELATALNANFDDTDIEMIDVSEDDGLAIFRAKPNSLGWIGRIGVAKAVTPPWTCAGVVTTVAIIQDSSNGASLRTYRVRVREEGFAATGFTIAGQGKLGLLIAENPSLSSYLTSKGIAYNTVDGDKIRFTSTNQTSGFQFEIEPVDANAEGMLGAAPTQDNTSIEVMETGVLRFCLATALPDATAVSIVEATTIETTNGDATVQLTYTTTPTEANTDSVAIWSITSVSPFATINESTGELMIVDAPDASTITVRLETINGVFTTKTFTTNDSQQV